MERTFSYAEHAVKRKCSHMRNVKIGRMLFAPSLTPEPRLGISALTFGEQRVSSRRVFCVEAFCRRGAELRQASHEQFDSGCEAEEAALALSLVRAGVVLYQIDVDGDSKPSSEPELISTHGDVPVAG